MFESGIARCPMDQRSSAPTSQQTARPTRDFFDVYEVAIDDLHRTRSLAQKIDTMYVTILTLLLTADAYEIAIPKFDSWAPIVATAGGTLVGLFFSSRLRPGAANLSKRHTNLHDAQRRAGDSRPY